MQHVLIGGRISKNPKITYNKNRIPEMITVYQMEKIKLTFLGIIYFSKPVATFRKKQVVALRQTLAVVETGYNEVHPHRRMYIHSSLLLRRTVHSCCNWPNFKLIVIVVRKSFE